VPNADYFDKIRADVDAATGDDQDAAKAALNRLLKLNVPVAALADLTLPRRGVMRELVTWLLKPEAEATRADVAAVIYIVEAFPPDTIFTTVHLNQVMNILNDPGVTSRDGELNKLVKVVELVQAAYVGYRAATPSIGQQAGRAAVAVLALGAASGASAQSVFGAGGNAGSIADGSTGLANFSGPVPTASAAMMQAPTTLTITPMTAPGVPALPVATAPIATTQLAAPAVPAVPVVSARSAATAARLGSSNRFGLFGNSNPTQQPSQTSASPAATSSAAAADAAIANAAAAEAAAASAAATAAADGESCLIGTSVPDMSFVEVMSNVVPRATDIAMENAIRTFRSLPVNFNMAIVYGLDSLVGSLEQFWRSPIIPATSGEKNFSVPEQNVTVSFFDIVKARGEVNRFKRGATVPDMPTPQFFGRLQTAMNGFGGLKRIFEQLVYGATADIAQIGAQRLTAGNTTLVARQKTSPEVNALVRVIKDGATDHPPDVRGGMFAMTALLLALTALAKKRSAACNAPDQGDSASSAGTTSSADVTSPSDVTEMFEDALANGVLPSATRGCNAWPPRGRPVSSRQGSACRTLPTLGPGQPTEVMPWPPASSAARRRGSACRQTQAASCHAAWPPASHRQSTTRRPSAARKPTQRRGARRASLRCPAPKRRGSARR